MSSETNYFVKQVKKKNPSYDIKFLVKAFGISFPNMRTISFYFKQDFNIGMSYNAACSYLDTRLPMRKIMNFTTILPNWNSDVILIEDIDQLLLKRNRDDNVPYIIYAFREKQDSEKLLSYDQHTINEEMINIDIMINELYVIDTHIKPIYDTMITSKIRYCKTGLTISIDEKQFKLGQIIQPYSDWIPFDIRDIKTFLVLIRELPSLKATLSFDIINHSLLCTSERFQIWAVCKNVHK